MITYGLLSKGYRKSQSALPVACSAIGAGNRPADAAAVETAKGVVAITAG
jgi:hypothetical protein